MYSQQTLLQRRLIVSQLAVFDCLYLSYPTWLISTSCQQTLCFVIISQNAPFEIFNTFSANFDGVTVHLLFFRALLVFHSFYFSGFISDHDSKLISLGFGLLGLGYE